MKSTEKERLIKSDIQSIENRVRHAFNQGYDLGYKDGLQKNIKALQSVKSKPKTGHWVYKIVRGENIPCCSRCGLDNGTHDKFNFCPECGAKMVESEVKE